MIIDQKTIRDSGRMARVKQNKELSADSGTIAMSFVIFMLRIYV